MDIGDIAYLIFVVGALIVSSIANKKKKKQQPQKRRPQPQQHQPEPKKAKEFFDLEKMLSDFGEKEPEQKTYSPVSAKEEVKYKSLSEQLKEKRAKEEAEQIASEANYDDEFESYEHLTDEEYYELLKGDGTSPLQVEHLDAQTGLDFEFDAKKAIIYSEIMKRPEY